MKLRVLTDDEIAHVIDITRRRRAAYVRLAEDFPTNEQLAENLEVSLATINNLARGMLPKSVVPRESSSTLENDLLGSAVKMP